jgi:hypothetical protein
MIGWKSTLLLLEFHSTPLKFLHDLRRFLEFGQRLQVAVDVGPIELAGLANDNAFHVKPVFGTGGEYLQQKRQPWDSQNV